MFTMKSGMRLGILIALGVMVGLSISQETPESTMATTFRVCNKTAERHRFFDSKPIEEKLKRQRYYRNSNATEILQMTKFPQRTYLSENGFIYTVMDAYNLHHNLIIRPDDVWAAIMTQFSFYVNKHAEEFRGKFVNFEGQKELTVSIPGSLRSASYDTLVKLMSQEIHKNLVDPQVKSWILPNFSTTTDNDLVTTGVVFMATMKKYFKYIFNLSCGIPHITLEGTVEDWQNIYGRLEKLKEYKLERWYDMLEPVVKQFVNARQGNVDEDFWQKIVNHEGGASGPSYISGWITVFAVFDEEGNWQRTTSNRNEQLPWAHVSSSEENWLRIDTNYIPLGVVEVDVKINDNGKKYNSVMFAGHMGTETKADNSTVQPTLGWAIALKP